MRAGMSGQVDTDSAVPGTLRRLAALRPDAPVLSLYLDLDPQQLPTQRDRRAAMNSLLDEARKRAEELGGAHDAKLSLRGDVERASAFLDDWSPKGAHGLALFCASGADLFEAIPL